MAIADKTVSLETKKSREGSGCTCCRCATEGEGLCEAREGNGNATGGWGQEEGGGVNGPWTGGGYRRTKHILKLGWKWESELPVRGGGWGLVKGNWVEGARKGHDGAAEPGGRRRD